MNPLDRHLVDVVSTRGFHATRRPGLFGRREHGNLAILSFARASYSSEGEVTLLPFASIVSDRLARYFPVSMEVHWPEVGVQHWFRSGKDIHNDASTVAWDDLSEADSSTWEAADLHLISHILPELERHTSDEGLRDCWVDHEDPWMSEAIQAAYLAVLSKDLGPREAFEASRGRLAMLLAEQGTRMPGFGIVRPALDELGLSY